MGRILIADDHDALRRGLARALTPTAGHEVEEAPNGNQAIERLHEGHFDVVLSDLKMGGSDGMDVLRTTKTLHPSYGGDSDDRVRTVRTAVEAMKSARTITSKSRSKAKRSSEPRERARDAPHAPRKPGPAHTRNDNYAPPASSAPHPLNASSASPARWPRAIPRS